MPKLKVKGAVQRHEVLVLNLKTVHLPAVLCITKNSQPLTEEVLEVIVGNWSDWNGHQEVATVV